MGRTTIGFKKPMAVGTRNWFDRQSATGRSDWVSARVFCKTGSRVAVSTAMQLARSLLNCQRPIPTLAKAKPAINAHARKMYCAHELGSVTAEAALREIEFEVIAD